MSRYHVTATLDGTTIVNREFSSLLAAQVFASQWSVGDFEVVIQALKAR